MHAAEVTVFLADLNDHFLFEESMHDLHPSTLAVLEQITHPLRKKQIIASRIILKRMLSRYMGREISLCEDQQTRLLRVNPEASDNTQLQPQVSFPYHWSISHTASHIGVVISRAAVGFDMERIDQRRRFVDIARFVFHVDESEMLEQASHADNIAKSFFEIWTLREAAYKLAGWGPFERAIPVKTYLQHQQFFFCTQLIENNLIYSITSKHPSPPTIKIVCLHSFP